MAEECGCFIDRLDASDADSDGERGQILRCPMHAEAKNMLAALEDTANGLDALINAVGERFGLPNKPNAGHEHAKGLVGKARILAARARGGAA